MGGCFVWGINLMNIMGFLLLGESRVTHDTDGKTGIPVVMSANSQAFRGLCQTNYTGDSIFHSNGL